jgi:hypothetical protein
MGDWSRLGRSFFQLAACNGPTYSPVTQDPIVFSPHCPNPAATRPSEHCCRCLFSRNPHPPPSTTLQVRPLSHSITAFIFLICQLQLPITTVDLLALATCACHRFCLGSGPHGVGARRGPWQPTSLYRRFYRYHLPSFSCGCHFAVSIIPIAHFLVNLLFPVDVVAAKIEPKLANVLIR